MLLKICGMTDPETAKICLKLGADMVGLVYYPPSPRHVGIKKIEAILDAAEPFRQQKRKTVLVVVDTLPERIDPRIDFIQLHGTLKEQRTISCKTIHVIKNQKAFDDLMTHSEVMLDSSHQAENTADQSIEFLLEMSSGILPGGNGTAWNWSLAAPFCRRYQTLLAGGITPDNVCEAIEKAQPAGIDVSSGVESSPGIKDFDKIERFIRLVRESFANFRQSFPRQNAET